MEQNPYVDVEPPAKTKYSVNEDVRAGLAIRFTYHAPKNDQPDRYVDLRAAAHTLAIMTVEMTPPSREQSLALTKLEEFVHWANASIARRE